MLKDALGQDVRTESSLVASPYLASSQRPRKSADLHSVSGAAGSAP